MILGPSSISAKAELARSNRSNLSDQNSEFRGLLFGSKFLRKL